MADEDKPFWSPPAADPALVAFRRQFDAARDPQTARNALGIQDPALATGAPLDAEYITAVDDPTLPNDRALTDTATVTWDFSTPGQAKATAVGSGGSGAPDNAEYIVSSSNATLTAERVLTDTASVTWDFSTAGQAKANATGGGGSGNVSTSGIPVTGQYGRWVTTTTIEGVTTATVLSDIGAQPLDGDLTSLAAAFLTDVIYYRSATDTWAAVTIGSGLSFTLGTLSATGGGGGGNVSNSGLPTTGQYARWVDAVTIQGVSPATVLSDIGAQPAGSYQPLDADLTALAGVTGTNTIYYRSAANTWTAVNISTGLAFSGGNLTATGGGAPTSAEYITSTTDAGLSAERVLTDTATVTWDRTVAGQISANAVGGAGGTSISQPQGRLTLQTLTPVMVTTQSAKTTLFYTPYLGNQCPIYSGTFAMTTFAEISNLTTASAVGNAGPAAVAANSNYDLFVWNNAGTMTLTRGPAWTNLTTRSAGTALVMVNGILLNAVAITNGPAIQRGTYVGTVTSNASSQLNWTYGTVAAGGTAGLFGVWNCYNREPVCSTVGDTTDTWSYGTAAWQNANASAAMRHSFVVGLNVARAAAIYSSQILSNTAGGIPAIGIGFDSSAAATGVTGASYSASAVTVLTGTTAHAKVYPGIGFHYFQAIEYGASGATFYGDGGATHQKTGLIFDFLM